jgi:hypothetical protein
MHMRSEITYTAVTLPGSLEVYHHRVTFSSPPLSGLRSESAVSSGCLTLLRLTLYSSRVLRPQGFRSGRLPDAV